MKTKFFLSLLLMLLAFSTVSLGQQPIYINGGDVGGSLWTNYNSQGIDYIITSDIYISSTTSLTIAQGTEIAFAGLWYIYQNMAYWQGSQLDVYGNIKAAGALNNDIIFEPYDYISNPHNLGYGISTWEGIRFISSLGTSFLDYCVITGVNKPSHPVNGCSCSSPNSPKPEYSGAIYIENLSNLAITNCQIFDNEVCAQGGGIYCGINSSPTISNNGIYNNISNKRGGGICVMWNSFPNIEWNIIETNIADEKGGGIWIGRSSSPNIYHNEINDNISGFGGGIGMCNQVNANIYNNLIVNNYANVDGGGSYMINTSNPIFINNTIADNYANVDAGGIYSDNTCNPEFTNDIIYFNTPNPVNINLNTNSSTFNHCDIDDPTLLPYPGNSFFTFNDDPVFAHMNGYPNQGYRVRASLSNCIDHGNSNVTAIVVDLDGFFRKWDIPTQQSGFSIDIGAYENNGSNPPIAPPLSIDKNDNNDIIVSCYPNPVNNVL
ncbi:MAG: right-handed parallel beta-helix repeat-containing protein, partial [candidate division Zixibacteria bacterium]|nr:right-handed parallel beta-helix repeat-containing protein [candidate division Zixibacteria bacterium]